MAIVCDRCNVDHCSVPTVVIVLPKTVFIIETKPIQYAKEARLTAIQFVALLVG